MDRDVLNDVGSEDFHIGHLFMSHLIKRPNDINQIDAATGEKETNASVLARSIRLAKCLRKWDLQPGDVMALGGRNHLDLQIPHYAALFNGLPVAGVDPLYKYDEIHTLFKIIKPKIAFCQMEQYEYYRRAVDSLGLDTKIVSFDEGENSFAKLMDTQDDDSSEFKLAVFDLDKVYAWLVSTGGTTGSAKVAAIKHLPLLNKTLTVIRMYGQMKSQDGENIELALNLSPVQWISGFFNAVATTLMNRGKLQTSAPQTIDHVIDIINKYKPVSLLSGSPLITSILRHEKKCDLTCFNNITVTGGKVYKDLLVELKSRMRKDALLIEAYGQSECLGLTFRPNPFGPLGNCGKPFPEYQMRLVDAETGKEITEPNTPGELWSRGPSFTEYYDNPEETSKVLTRDGWYKTGDILYRDEEDNYFFVERISALIKYRSYQVIPVEIEELIRTHPSVYDVCVTSIPDEQDGEHPVACVVCRPGHDVTAQEIKNLVASTLSENKQLRGGVVFMEGLPLTSTGKVPRMRLRQMVSTAKRE